MNISKLEITNWGPHEHLVVDMDSPVVGIIGANGSGKSNILQALNYALTGNLNKRTGASYIRNHGMPGGADKAYVKVEFTAGGAPGLIWRELGERTSRRKLEWDGKVYTKDADVKRVMRDIVGADEAALANAVFIVQGTIADLVKGTPSERNDIFRKLMNLNFAEARANDVMAKIQSLQAGIVDRGPELEMCIAREAAILMEEGDLEEGIGKDEKLLSCLPELKDAIGFLKRASSLQAEVNACSGKRGVIVDRVSSSLHSIGAKDIAAAEADVAKVAAEAAKSKELADNIAKYRDAKARLELDRENLADSEEMISIYRGKLDGIDLDDLSRRKDELESMARLSEQAARLDREYGMLMEEVGNCDDAVKKAKAESANAAAKAKDAEERLSLSAELERNAAGAQLKLDMIRSGVAGVCPCCGNKITISEGDTEEALTEAISKFKYESGKAKETALQDMRAAQSAKTALKQAKLLLENKTKAMQDKGLELNSTERKLVTMAGLLDIPVSIYETVDPADIASALETASKLLSDGLSVRSMVEAEERTIASLTEDIASRERILSCIDQDVASADEARVREECATLAEKAGRMSTSLASAKADMKELDMVDAEVFRLSREMQEASSAASGILDMNAGVNASLEAWERDGHLQDGTDNDYVELAAWLTELNGSVEARRARLKAVVDEKEGVVARISEIRSCMERNERKRALIEDLEKVRNVVGKNGAPLMYVNAVFDSISGIVGELLQKMGSNFSVEPDPEQPVTFRFTRTDNDSGYSMPQEQLSGGQAVRLSLALLIAAQQVILPDVGLLVLDEPSSHIDADGVENMRDMFRNMAGFLGSAGLQVVIVDHNEVLTSAFGKTLSL